MSSVSSSYIKQVLKHVKFFVDHRSIKKELNSHITDLIDEHQWHNLPEEELNRHIQEEMGNPNEIGQELNKVHHPLLGYVWLISRAVFFVILCFSLFNFYQTLVLSSSDRQIESDERLNTKNLIYAIGSIKEIDYSNIQFKEWDIHEVIEFEHNTIVFERVLLLEDNNLVLVYRGTWKFNILNDHDNILIPTFLELRLENGKEYIQDIDVSMSQNGMMVILYKDVPYDTQSIFLNFEQASKSFNIEINGNEYE